MTRTITALTLPTATAVIAALSLIGPARADDVASLATGGYARGLQTAAMMHMIDVNKDGMVSADEWTTFQERSFDALDKDKSGFLEHAEFAGAPKDGGAFATAAYVRGLMSDEMFRKIDANGDGKISKEEFVSYQRRVFEMLDKSGKGMVGPTDFIRKAG
jgi:Ca2+-binding EF-hand superfamily protein